MLKMQQCEKCVVAVGRIEAMRREVMGALLMSCTSDCPLAFLPVYPCSLFMSCSPVPHNSPVTQGWAQKENSVHSQPRTPWHTLKVTGEGWTLVCPVSLPSWLIVVYFLLAWVKWSVSRCVGSLRCKCHRTVVEPELIWHRTAKSILMGNYLCLNQHIPTA